MSWLSGPVCRGQRRKVAHLDMISRDMEIADVINIALMFSLFKKEDVIMQRLKYHENH